MNNAITGIEVILAREPTLPRKHFDRWDYDGWEHPGGTFLDHNSLEVGRFAYDLLRVGWTWKMVMNANGSGPVVGDGGCLQHRAFRSTLDAVASADRYRKATGKPDWRKRRQSPGWRTRKPGA